MGDRQYGIDPKRLAEYAEEIKEIHSQGVEIAIVIGGGNIFRGVAGASNGMDRVQGDYMGMLATVINGMALQGALEEKGMLTRLQTALKIEAIAEPYIKRRAVRHLEKGRIVICGELAEYNDSIPPQGPRPNHVLVQKSIRMEGFVVFDFKDEFDWAKKEIAHWLHTGKMIYKENLIEGFENIPSAFIGLFKGENIGKQMVKVASRSKST